MKKTVFFIAIVGILIIFLFFFRFNFKLGTFQLPDGVTIEKNDNYSKANFAASEGHSKQAIDFLLKAALEGYRHPFVYLNLAENYGALEKYDQALSLSQKAINILESNDIKVMYTYELNDFKDDKRIKTIANAYSQHSMILYELGRTEEAVLSANRALSLNPDDLRARDTLGKLALINKEYEKAIPIFQYFTRNSPKFVDAFFYLGQAQIGAGRTEDGKASLATYLKRVPFSHPNAQKARDLLQNN